MAEPEREIRFATVIYGGVSLAIYINGIVQEMLHLVRSTAADKESLKTIPWTNLTPVERVYRVLSTMVGMPASRTDVGVAAAGKPKRDSHRPGTAGLSAEGMSERGFASMADMIQSRLKRGDNPQYPIRTRFIVDILSGTSAGGINAIFLSKALAGNLSLKSLANMWIVDADLQNLLNDKKVKPSFLQQNPPDALLNARWMYRQLLIALQSMNEPHRPDEPTDLVDDLDLFCTTTDLLGIPAKIPLADETVEERRYRNFYHFKRRIGKVPEAGVVQPDPESRMKSDDFAAIDPFLAFAARCTSSFPFAFEPMVLQDAFEIIQSDPQFSEYISQDLEANAKELFGPDIARLQGADKFAYMCRIYADSNLLNGSGPSFKDRPFGDGGYLDNKPFTYAIEMIKKRHATLPVDRKLIYIEPSPESISAAHPPAKSDDKPARPNAVQNSLDALVVLPRYETIRQDIESVLNWNTDIARLHRVLDHFEQEIEARAPNDLRDVDKTLAYDSYWRLRLSGAADQLADCVAESLGVESSSDEGQAIRSIVGTWRETRFGAVASMELVKTDLRKKQQRFLDLFDFNFCEREIRFLRAHLQRLPEEQARKPLTQLAEITLKFMDLLNLTPVIGLTGVSLKCWDQYLQFIVDPKAAARAMGYTISGESPAGSKPIFLPDPEFLSATEAGRDSRVRWLMRSGDSIRVLSAEQCKCDTEELLRFSTIVDAVARGIVAHYVIEGVVYNPDPGDEPLSPAEGLTQLQRLHQDMEGLFQLVQVPEPTEPGTTPISGWEFFCVMDVQVYPILFGTTLGEFESVEVFRISPQDTRSISGTLPDLKADQSVNPPLCGDAFWAFGAFLDQRWRLSDMLRGRLDGAERLITAILPDSDPDTVSVRECLICAAQEAIATEWEDFQKPYQTATAKPGTLEVTP
jgi:patatin-related protein